MSKEILFFDNDAYKVQKDREQKLFDVLKELEHLHLKALSPDVDINYIKYLKDPLNYLVNEYWHRFANAPAHLYDNRESLFFNQTNIDKHTIIKLSNEFKKVFIALGSYAPTIKKESVKSNIKKSDFNRYLKPELKDKYNTLVQFVNSVKDLQKYYNVPIYNAQKCSNDLKLNGLKLEIELQKFI